MLVHGELETIARIFECLSLLINGGSVAMEPILRIFYPFWCQLEYARNEASKLGCLRRGSAWGFWFSSVGSMPVGVVFFPSLPYMGVMFFPSFVLGNVFGEGGTFFVLPFLFSPLLSLPLLSSSSPSLSFSLLFSSPFLPHLILHFSFPFTFPFAFLFLSFPLYFFLSSFFFFSFSFPLPLLRVFFFSELLVLFASKT